VKAERRHQFPVPFARSGPGRIGHHEVLIVRAAEIEATVEVAAALERDIDPAGRFRPAACVLRWAAMITGARGSTWPIASAAASEAASDGAPSPCARLALRANRRVQTVSPVAGPELSRPALKLSNQNPFDLAHNRRR